MSDSCEFSCCLFIYVYICIFFCLFIFFLSNQYVRMLFNDLSLGTRGKLICLFLHSFIVDSLNNINTCISFVNGWFYRCVASHHQCTIILILVLFSLVCNFFVVGNSTFMYYDFFFFFSLIVFVIFISHIYLITLFTHLYH